jgi:F-type H+-transporting ATPase subunit b
MYLLAFAETIQLFPDGTLFLHIGILLFMIWVLNRTLYKPINRVLEARERNKGGHSSEAEAILSQVEEKETRYNKEMLDARSRGYETIENERKKAIAAREKKLADVKTEIATSFDAGKAEIEKQSADARKSIGTEAEKMADSIAAGILRG